MKLLKILFLAYSFFYASGALIASVECIDPLLIVVIMVKNEETVIKPTLEPYVKAGVKAFLVFDTGSTDQTMENAQALFDEYNITQGYIIQEPFIDFATSRNRGLELAEEKFPQGGFMLMPDAEWYMHNVEGLISFCEQHVNDVQSSYMVRIVAPDLDFGTQRLIRCRSKIRFAGVVHETLEWGTHFKVPNDVFFELRPEERGIEKTRKRWIRDKDLLLREYHNNPFSSRNMFYLAQTFECLGEMQEAYKYYKLRSELIGWDEEDFQTFYRLGRVAEQIKVANGQCDWPLALSHYLKAFSMRPTRVEPLIKIANYYLQKGEHALAYLFIVRACQLPYPEHDVLFVEKDMYEYARHDIFGQSAWYMKEYDLGERAVLTALRTHPEYGHLKKNLEFYINRKLELHMQDVAEVVV